MLGRLLFSLPSPNAIPATSIFYIMYYIALYRSFILYLLNVYLTYILSLIWFKSMTIVEICERNSIQGAEKFLSQRSSQECDPSITT